MHCVIILYPTLHGERWWVFERLMTVIVDYSVNENVKTFNFWSFAGNSQGKNQPDGVLKGDRPFLIAPFKGGEKVAFHVPPSDKNQRHSKSSLKSQASHYREVPSPFDS